jgi:C-terminal processing protease CtpA/Prc
VVLWPSSKPETPTPPVPLPIQVIALSNDKKGTLMDAQDFASECFQGKTYVGIGLQFNLDQAVTVAPESYPAYKAGIRVGDQVLNPDFEPDADGYDVVDFTRHGKHHRLRIKTQWICLR